MNCYVHTDREPIGSCVTCGNLICSECDVVVAGKHYCRNCLAQGEPAPVAEPAYSGSGVGAPKQLMRSVSDRMLAGVCGGFARYADMDPNLVRILYVVATLATGMLVGIIGYVVAAVVIPEGDA
jgi:phage shock protein C